MSKKKPTVAERAVRGCLGGWVFGETRVCVTLAQDDGRAIGYVRIEVPAASVKKMLADEKREKKRTGKPHTRG